MKEAVRTNQWQFCNHAVPHNMSSKSRLYYCHLSERPFFCGSSKKAPSQGQKGELSFCTHEIDMIGSELETDPRATIGRSAAYSRSRHAEPDFCPISPCTYIACWAMSIGSANNEPHILYMLHYDMSPKRLLRTLLNICSRQKVCAG